MITSRGFFISGQFLNMCGFFYSDFICLHFQNCSFYRYEYDDSYVSKVEAATVMNAEAYVLFYRKNNLRIEPLREEVQTYLDQGSSLVQFYISRQWLNKFENFAEPGMSENNPLM